MEAPEQGAILPRTRPMGFRQYRQRNKELLRIHLVEAIMLELRRTINLVEIMVELQQIHLVVTIPELQRIHLLRFRLVRGSLLLGQAMLRGPEPVQRPLEVTTAPRQILVALLFRMAVLPHLQQILLVPIKLEAVLQAERATMEHQIHLGVPRHRRLRGQLLPRLVGSEVTALGLLRRIPLAPINQIQATLKRLGQRARKLRPATLAILVPLNRLHRMAVRPLPLS